MNLFKDRDLGALVLMSVEYTSDIFEEISLTTLKFYNFLSYSNVTRFS